MTTTTYHGALRPGWALDSHTVGRENRTSARPFDSGRVARLLAEQPPVAEFVTLADGCARCDWVVVAGA